MGTLRITRFSYEAFDPQPQDNYLKENFIIKDKNYNPGFNRGVWVFVLGEEDKYLLNHLDEEEIVCVSCWEGEIPLDAVVYKHDSAYLKSAVSTVEVEKNEGAFFIPEESIHKVMNVKPIYNRFSTE